MPWHKWRVIPAVAVIWATAIKIISNSGYHSHSTIYIQNRSTRIGQRIWGQFSSGDGDYAWYWVNHVCHVVDLQDAVVEIILKNPMRAGTSQGTEMRRARNHNSLLVVSRNHNLNPLICETNQTPINVSSQARSWYYIVCRLQHKQGTDSNDHGGHLESMVTSGAHRCCQTPGTRDVRNQIAYCYWLREVHKTGFLYCY